MSKQQISQFDKMTKTPIPKLIIMLSIPTIISMLVSNIYNLVDTKFVGKLGTSASGAVGIVFGYMAILQAIGFLFGQGSGSIMSRQLGKQDTERASRTASTGFFYSFICSLIIGIISIFILDDLIMFLGSTKTIAPYAKTYITFIIAAAPFVSSSFTLNNLLRYEGKAVFGMAGMMTGAILNIGGDYLFMFKLNMGIAGAGLSTAISQVIGFIILVSAFLRHKTQCTLSLRYVYFDIKPIANIMATGFPSLLRQALNSISTIILNTEARVYGDSAVAAMSIVSRVGFFVFAVAIGIGQGFQPVSAFNYGAGKYDRVRKAFFTTMALAEATIIAFSLAVFFNASNIVWRFREDMDVVRVGTRALKLYVLAQLTLPPSMSCEMLYQSTGRKLGASLMSAMRNGIFFIPALLILSHVRGLAGIQEAQPLAFVIALPFSIMFAIIYFKKYGEKAQAERAERALR